MSRRLSVGTRWALLYAAVTLLVLSVPIGFVYVSMRSRIEGDARLLLNSYMTEIRAEIEAHPDRPEQAIRELTAQLRRVSPALEHGAALLDASGAPVAQAGSLRERSFALPEPLRAGERSEILYRSGGRKIHPDLVAASAVPGGFVQVSISSRRFEESIDQMKKALALAAPLGLLLSALAGAWLARRSLRPIAQMTDSARRISGDNLSERIPVRGTDDELDRLAITLNRMFDRLASSMERLHDFTVDAAHQLKSPIATLQNEIEVTLGEDEIDADTRCLLEALLRQVVELATSVGAMLRLARSEVGLTEAQVVPVDVGEVLDGVATLFQPMAEARGVSLELEVGAPASIPGDVAWLRVLFSNLVQNALDHTPEGGGIQLVLTAKKDEVSVRVSDTGSGIPKAEHQRIFDRFYRVSSARDTTGSGLGLTLAKQIALAHGGDIEVESEPGKGSTFAVRLPTRRGRAAGRSRRRGTSRPATGSGDAG